MSHLRGFPQSDRTETRAPSSPYLAICSGLGLEDDEQTAEPGCNFLLVTPFPPWLVQRQVRRGRTCGRHFPAKDAEEDQPIARQNRAPYPSFSSNGYVSSSAVDGIPGFARPPGAEGRHRQRPGRRVQPIAFGRAGGEQLQVSRRPRQHSADRIPVNKPHPRPSKRHLWYSV